MGCPQTLSRVLSRNTIVFSTVGTWLGDCSCPLKVRFRLSMVSMNQSSSRHFVQQLKLGQSEGDKTRLLSFSLVDGQMDRWEEQTRQHAKRTSCCRYVAPPLCLRCASVSLKPTNSPARRRLFGTQEPSWSNRPELGDLDSQHGVRSQQKLQAFPQQLFTEGFIYHAMFDRRLHTD